MSLICYTNMQQVYYEQQQQQQQQQMESQYYQVLAESEGMAYSKLTGWVQLTVDYYLPNIYLKGTVRCLPHPGLWLV